MATAAQAQATRTWVSGVGDDANPCSRTAPCKTFAGAISKTAAGGEIDVLDPGGYGAVTITKSITIDGGVDPGGVLNAGTNGININAASTDTVTLRNIKVQGVGTGLAGIKINSAGTVHIENCLLANNTQKGIDCQSTTAIKLFVNDTEIRGNTNGANGGGIFLKPNGVAAQAYLNNVKIDKNTFGLRAEDNTTTSAVNCSFSGNTTHGVVSVSATSIVNLSNCTISANGGSGLRATLGGTIRYSNCTIVNNSIGLEQIGGNLVTFSNNTVAGNTTAGSSTASIPLQ
jgi:hypothetical protein